MAALAVSVAVLAGAAGVSVAAFSASGSAVSYGTVGTTGLAVTATADNPHGGPLFPGTVASDQTLDYTARDPSSTTETITSETATVTASGAYIVTNAAGTAVQGCLASWFAATVASPAPGTVLHVGAATTLEVTLSMRTVTTTERACQGHAPKVTLSVQAG